ncbi:MAG: hypothetical protein ABFC94_18595 [Syntrophomonas sp.]
MNQPASVINQQQYTSINTGISSLAWWARILEIIIPAYMFGKSWGMVQEKNIELFRMQFPAFLIDTTKALNNLVTVKSEYLMRFISTTSGALIALLVIIALAAVIHFILQDRNFVDSLRFTAVTIIPLAVLNGLLAQVLQTILDNTAVQSIASLKMSILYMPWGFLMMTLAFYLVALWVMGKRTGVSPKKRWLLIGVGLSFVAVYVAGGLMISPNEWQMLIS